MNYFLTLLILVSLVLTGCASKKKQSAAEAAQVEIKEDKMFTYEQDTTTIPEPTVTKKTEKKKSPATQPKKKKKKAETFSK